MDKPITILHTEWSDGWGGQEIRILAESIALIKKGYRVIIAAKPNSQLLARAKDAQVRVLPIKMNKGLNIMAILKLFFFIKKEAVSIVHTHSSVDSRTAGIAGKLARIKVVRSRHISIPVSKSRLTWFQYMVLADRLITSGKFIKDMLVKENKMLPDRIVSAPAGVDENLFRPDGKKSLDREVIGLKKENFVVGMVSVLRSWKGHEFVIRAISSLIKKIPNIHLLIVGDGPVRKDIINLIEELKLQDCVTLSGHQVDPVPFYQEMDVVILPSYAGEATSQTLPQAMLMNKPVISTNIGGLAEVVIDRKTGLVVEPKDTRSIYEAILEIYTNKDLREKMKSNARQHALKNFTFNQMIKTTEDVYLDLLN